MSHRDRQRWNEKYREADPAAFDSAPSGWLEEHRTLLQEHAGGRALDLACGHGRNAFCLAELGYTVDAVDISDVAVARVNAEATRRRLAVEAQCLDLETDPFPNAGYAVVVDFNYLERSIFDDIRSSLTRGGLLIFQTRLRDQCDRVGSGIDPRFTLDPNELLDAFSGSGFRVLHYREAVSSLGGGEDGERALAGLVARRT